jgi:hypothetical protein
LLTVHPLMQPLSSLWQRKDLAGHPKRLLIN